MATTLATLTTLVRERVDMESGLFCTDSMIASWLNQAQDELYDLVVAAFKDHFWTTADFTLVGGTVSASQYTMSGVRFMRGLEWAPGTTNREMMKPWSWGEKDGVNVPRYRMLGGVIQIEPYEYSAGTYRLYYVPNPSTLTSQVNLDDKLDQWHEHMVLNAAIKARAREQSDVTDLRIDMERVERRIVAMASLRDTGSPPRTNDVSQETPGNWWR